MICTRPIWKVSDAEEAAEPACEAAAEDCVCSFAPHAAKDTVIAKAKIAAKIISLPPNFLFCKLFNTRNKDEIDLIIKQS